MLSLAHPLRHEDPILGGRVKLVDRVVVLRAPDVTAKQEEGVSKLNRVSSMGGMGKRMLA